MENNTSILDMLQKAKKGIESEVRFDLALPNDVTLNCSFRKSDALRLPEQDRLIFEVKLTVCEKQGLHEKSINEAEWEREFEEQVRLITESNAKKPKDQRIDLNDYKKRLQRQRPTNRAEQVAKDLARMALISDVIPKLIRINDKLLNEAEQVEFADIITSDTSLSKIVIDKYIQLSELFNKKTEEAKN